MSVYVVKSWKGRVARVYSDEGFARNMASFLATGLGLVAQVDMYEFCEQGWDEELVHLVNDEWEVQDFTRDVAMFYKDGKWESWEPYNEEY